MNTIQVNPLTTIEDARGYIVEIQSHNRNVPSVACFRKAGSICGQHFHNGGSGKNPEIIYLLYGSISIEWRDINNKEKLHKMENIEAPSIIKIYPFIWHKVIILKDSVFIELNSLKEGKEDTNFISESSFD